MPKSEPHPSHASTRMPADLPEEARPYWRKIAPMLRRLKLLTEADVFAAADLCLCLARMCQAEAIVQKEGLLVHGERGMVKNPAAQMAREYRQAVQRWASRFGLSPADREGISVAEAEPQDEFTTYLKLVNGKGKK